MEIQIICLLTLACGATLNKLQYLSFSLTPTNSKIPNSPLKHITRLTEIVCEIAYK